MADVDAFRPVWAEVDLDAVRANVRALRALVAPAALCAVVKADGYGHGAVPVSRAAVEAGADCLAVALVEEGVQLREAGIDAPIIVLSEPVPAAARDRRRAPPHAGRVHRRPVSTRSRRRCARSMRREPLAVHLKVDTGMHRVGCDPDDAVDLAAHVVDLAELRLAGVCTHFAVADEPGNEYTEAQQRTFEERARGDARTRTSRPASCTRATRPAPSRYPAARYDMVRVGHRYLRDRSRARRSRAWSTSTPALSVKARVSHVQAAAGRALGSPTGCGTRPRSRRASRRCRSGTPTACRASWRITAARC